MTEGARLPIFRRFEAAAWAALLFEDKAMKVRNSLKSAKLRDKGSRVVRRRGRLYVINKRNPRFKARQG